MKKVLVTGGPVHAYLDPVKIVTNRFKGGTMALLASDLMYKHDCEVKFVCSKAVTEAASHVGESNVVHHDGFMDYMATVNGMAKDFDAVILGAAVANLIPAEPWTSKFPSHNYKPGDIVNIPFVIAPRVIAQVKANMKPGAHLFGFKLLSGQPFDELIRAAYDLLLESGATVVFANDPQLGLDKKFAVTKERAVIPVSLTELPEFIKAVMDDEYYHTVEVPWVSEGNGLKEAEKRVRELIYANDSGFVEVNGMKFGTVAWRAERGFVTTARGKKETEELAYVLGASHDSRAVTVLRNNGGTSKATLNAPLLARIFEKNPTVHGILHFHHQEAGLTMQGWAPPGTVRDTERDVREPFNVEGHGCYLFLNEKGEVIR